MTGTVAGEYLSGHTSMIRRDPVGVVASIAPWNYPLMMMAWKLGPAIGGGNTVVFKPSEQTPLTALKMAHILAEELPEGVVSVGGDWYFQEYTPGQGVSRLGTGDGAVEGPIPAPAVESQEKRSILDLFRN